MVGESLAESVTASHTSAGLPGSTLVRSTNKKLNYKPVEMGDNVVDEPPMKRLRSEHSRSNIKAKKEKPIGRKAFLSHEGQPLPDVEYYFEKGLRKVKPYKFVYQTYAKGRWQGRPIIEVFAKEFQDKPRDYYEKAICTGKILINNERISLDYVLRNGDLLSHSIHRHEPPISDQTVEIVYSDTDMLVVNKPSSIPIHPTGRYHHNTILHILRSPEFNYSNLFPVNRLDRLTSGLCLIARNKKRSQELMVEFQQRNVEKTYLCRVRGEFPTEEIICEEPILTVSHKLGVNTVSPEGKECKTIFKRWSYNGLTSVVECKPLTGRTHQIRVHLQYLGYPIANDPIYCCDIWGPSLGKGGIEKGQLDSVLKELTPHAYPQDVQDHTDSALITVGQLQSDAEEASSNQQIADTLEADCSECLIQRMDPIPEQLQIWLHSWKCEWDRGKYETPIPNWADPDFDGDKKLIDRFWKHGGKWDGLACGVLVEES
ncbi:RluA family pseudouridine synthase [Spizellomyces punctatus DAOM BR117]|uniref:Pseudouridine synthase n=1 Tax=Spizellomyces punctatus (strain DAOM BR117) TaxID=645134 RepID=A0A0L0HKV4_SPIPD|nr:RluA family pseudouridine synthase [Spizellomyces punctatus DAOM BR117]KND01530.1 RluA family pseudouridine synthase [Spizellomyces punctatus DAOM BR117]|eukprot:XP_016609569.1 RluA family pseudouridine synthase [Spizellomyces punctatus DAOM BR117]